jgi:1-acyl-sn-glycerol-3-phosphate acyltransferase
MKAGILPDPASDWRNSIRWYTHKTPTLYLIRFISIPTMHLMARTECVGLENVPLSGPFILASNHLSNWDVMYLGVLLPRHPYYMAKVELFKNPVLGWVIRQGGAFPIYRGESDEWAMQQAGRVLAAGRMLCMFPEGTRSKGKAQMRRGKVGAVKLALDYQVPIIPAAITGTENFRAGIKSNTIRLQVGQPMDMRALAGNFSDEREILRPLTTLLMKQIAAMLPPEYRGAYA